MEVDDLRTQRGASIERGESFEVEEHQKVNISRLLGGKPRGVYQTAISGFHTTFSASVLEDEDEGDDDKDQSEAVADGLWDINKSISDADLRLGIDDQQVSDNREDDRFQTSRWSNTSDALLDSRKKEDWCGTNNGIPFDQSSRNEAWFGGEDMNGFGQSSKNDDWFKEKDGHVSWSHAYDYETSVREREGDSWLSWKTEHSKEGDNYPTESPSDTSGEFYLPFDPDSLSAASDSITANTGVFGISGKGVSVERGESFEISKSAKMRSQVLKEAGDMSLFQVTFDGCAAEQRSSDDTVEWGEDLSGLRGNVASGSDDTVQTKNECDDTTQNRETALWDVRWRNGELVQEVEDSSVLESESLTRLVMLEHTDLLSTTSEDLTHPDDFAVQGQALEAYLEKTPNSFGSDVQGRANPDYEWKEEEDNPENSDDVLSSNDISITKVLEADEGMFPFLETSSKTFYSLSSLERMESFDTSPSKTFKYQDKHYFHDGAGGFQTSFHDPFLDGDNPDANSKLINISEDSNLESERDDSSDMFINETVTCNAEASKLSKEEMGYNSVEEETTMEEEREHLSRADQASTDDYSDAQEENRTIEDGTVDEMMSLSVPYTRLENFEDGSVSRNFLEFETEVPTQEGIDQLGRSFEFLDLSLQKSVVDKSIFVQERRKETEEHSEDEEIQSMEHSEADDETGEEETKDFLHRHERVASSYSVERMESFEATTPGLIRSSKIEGFNAAGGGFHTSFHSLMTDNQEEDARGSTVDLLVSLDSQATSSYRDVLSDERTTKEDRETNINDSDGTSSTKDIQGKAETVEVSFRPPSSLTHSKGILNGDEISVARQADADLLLLTLSSPTQTFSSSMVVPTKLEPDEDMIPFLETDSKTLSSLPSLERAESFDTSPSRTLKYQTQHYFHVGAGGFQTSFYDPFLDGDNPGASNQLGDIEANIVDKDDLVPEQDLQVVAETAETSHQSPSSSAPLYPQGTLPSDEFDGLSSADSKQHGNPFLLTDSSDSLFRPAQTESEQENSVPSNELLIKAKEQSETEEIHRIFSSPALAPSVATHAELEATWSTSRNEELCLLDDLSQHFAQEAQEADTTDNPSNEMTNDSLQPLQYSLGKEDTDYFGSIGHAYMELRKDLSVPPKPNTNPFLEDYDENAVNFDDSVGRKTSDAFSTTNELEDRTLKHETHEGEKTVEYLHSTEEVASMFAEEKTIQDSFSGKPSSLDLRRSLFKNKGHLRGAPADDFLQRDSDQTQLSVFTPENEANSLTQNLSRNNPFREDADLHVLAEADIESTYQSYGYPLDESPVKDNIYEGFDNTKSHPDFFPGEKAKSPHDFENTAGCSESENVAFSTCRKLTFEERLSLEKDDAQTDSILVSYPLTTPENGTGGLSDNIPSSPLNPYSDDGVDDGVDSNDVDHTSVDDTNNMSDEDAAKDGDVTVVKQNRSSHSETHAHTDLPVEEDAASSSRRREVVFGDFTSMDQQILSRDSQTVSEMTRRYSMDTSPSSPFEYTFKTSAALKEVEYNYRQWSQDIQQEALPESRHMDGTDFMSSALQYPDHTAGKDGHSSPKDNTRQTRASFAESSEATDDFDDDSLDEKDATESDYLSEDSKSLDVTARGWGVNAKSSNDKITECEDTLIYSSVSKDQQKYVSTDDDYSFFENEREAVRTEMVSSKPGLQENIAENPFIASAEFVQEDVPVMTGTTHPDVSFQPSDTISTFKQTHQNEPLPHEVSPESEVHDDEPEFREAVIERFEAQEALDEHLFLSPQTRFEHETSSWSGIGSSFAPVVQQDFGSFSVSMSSPSAEHASTTDTGVIGEDTHEERSSRDEPEDPDTCDNKSPQQSTAVTAEVKLDASNTFSEAAYMQFTQKLESLTAERIFDNKTINENGEVQVAGLSAELPLVANVPPNSAADSIADSEASGAARDDDDDGNERGYDEDDVFVTSTDVHGDASSEDRRMSSLSHSSRSTSTSGSHSGSRRSSSDICHAEAWLPEGDTVTSELLLAVRQGNLENARAVVEEGYDGFVPTEERVRSRAHVRTRPEILSSTSWSTSEQEDDEQPQTHAPRRRHSRGAELEAAVKVDLWRAYEADDDATCSDRDVPRIAGKLVQTPPESEDIHEDSLSHENYTLSRHQPDNISGATDDDMNLLSRSLVFHRSRSTTDDFPVVEDSVEESTVLVNFYSPAHKTVTISEDTHQSIEEHLQVTTPAPDEPKSVHGLRHSHEGEDLAEEDDHISSNSSECEDLTNKVEKEETIGSFENHDFEAFVLHRTQEVTAFEEKGDAAGAAETWSITEGGAQQTDNFNRAFEESEFYEAKMAAEKERSILLKEKDRERPWSSVDDENDLAFLEAGHDERRSPNSFVRSSERNPSDSTSTSSRQTLSTTGTGSIDELRGSLGQLDIQDLSIFTESESRVWSEQRSPTLELQVGLKADDAGQHLEDSFDLMDRAELMHVNETFTEPPATIAHDHGLVTSEARITLKAGRREQNVGRYGHLRKTHEESLGGTFGSIQGASFSQSTDSLTLVAFEKLAAAEIESAAERGFASLNDSGCPSISSLDLSPPHHMSGDEPGSKSLSFADDITYQREQTTDEVFYLYDQQEKKDGDDLLEPGQSDELAEQEKTLGEINIFTEEKLAGDRKPTWMEKAINKARDVYSSVEKKLKRRKTRSRAQHPFGGLDDTKGEADLDYPSSSEEVDSSDDNEDTNPGDEDKWAWPSDGYDQTVQPLHAAAFDEDAGDADKPELLQGHKITARPQLQRVPSITSESEANLFTGDSRDEEYPDYKVTCLNDASPDSANLEDRSKGKEFNNIFDQLKSEAISASDIRGMGEEQAVKDGWDEKYTPSKQSGLEPGIEPEVSPSQLMEETAYFISGTSKEGEPQDVAPVIPAAPAKREDDINNFGALLVTNSLHQAVKELVVAGKDFFTESRLSTVAHEEDEKETIEDELIGVLEEDTDERLVLEDETACVHETVTEYEPFVDEDSVTKSNVEKQTFEKDEPVWEEDRAVMKLEQVVEKDTFIKDEQTVKKDAVIKYKKDVEEENVNEDESLIEEYMTAENNTVIEKKIDTDNESVSEEENVAAEEELVTAEESADIQKHETEEEHDAQDEVDSENEPVVEESLIPIQRNLHNSSLREKEVKTNDFDETLDSGTGLEQRSFEITKDEQIPSLQKEHFRRSSHSSIDSDYEKYFPFTDSEISHTAFSYTAVASAELSPSDVRYENDLVVEKETAESDEDSTPAGYLLPENDDSSTQAGFTFPHSPKIPETEALSEPFTPDYVKYAEIRQDEETRSTSTSSSDDEIVLSEKSPRLLVQTTIQNKDFTSVENDKAFVSSEQSELILQREDEIIEQRMSSELQCGTTYLGQEVFQTLTQSQDNSTEDEILNDESDSRLQASSASETENLILDNRCQSRLSLFKDDICQNDASFEAGENVQDEDTNDSVALTKSFRGDKEIRGEWLPSGYVQENSEALRSLQLEIASPVWQGDVNEAESREFFTSTPRTDTVSFTPEKFYYTSRETVQDRQAQEHFDLSEYPDVDVKVDERPTDLEEEGDIKHTSNDEDERTERSIRYHGSGRQDESYSEEVGAERLVQHDGHDKEVASAAQNEKKSESSLLLEESTQSTDSENEEEVAERSFMNDERQAKISVENEEGRIQISEKSPATNYLSETVEFAGENDVLARKRSSFETGADLLPADSYENSLGDAQWESSPDTNDDHIDVAEIQPLPRPLHRYDSSADDGLSSVDEEPEDNLSEDSTYEKEEPSQVSEWSIRRYSEEDAALGKISGDAEDTSRDTEIQSRDFPHDHDEENEMFMLAVSTDLETEPSVREDHDYKVEIEASDASFNQWDVSSVGRQREVDYDEECEEEAMQKQTAVSELSAKHEDEAYERGEDQAEEETKHSEQKQLLDVGEVTPTWFHIKDTFVTAFDWEKQGMIVSNTLVDPHDPGEENLKAIPEALQRQELESSVSGISDDEDELAAGSKQHAQSDKEREDIGKEDIAVSHEDEFTAAVSFTEEASALTVEEQDQESKVPETWVEDERSEVASDADGTQHTSQIQIQSTTPETEEELVKSFRNDTYLTRTHSAEEPRHDEPVSMPTPDNGSPGDVTSRPAIDDETYDDVTNIPTVEDQSLVDDISHKDNIDEDNGSFTHGQQVTECMPNVTEDLQSGDITRVPGIAEAGRSEDVASTENGDESELFASTKRIGDRLTSFTKMFKIAFSEERQSTDIPEVSDTLSKEQMPLEQTAIFASSKSIEKPLEFDKHGVQADRDASSEAFSLNLGDQVTQGVNEDNSTAGEEEVDVKENADSIETLSFSGNLENYDTYWKEDVSFATQETQDRSSSNAESRSLMQEEGAEERRNSFDAVSFSGYVDSEDTFSKTDVFPASKDLQIDDMVMSLPQDVSQKTPKDETFVSDIDVDYQEGSFSDAEGTLGRDEFSTRQPGNTDDVMIYQTDTLENTYSSDLDTRLFPTEEEMHVTEREPFEENLYIIRDKQSGGAQDSVSREMVLGDLLEEKLLLKASSHQAIERAFEFAKDEDSSLEANERRGMEEDSPWQQQSDSGSQIVREGLSLTSVQEHTEVSVKAFAVQAEVQPPVWKNEASQFTPGSSLVYPDESETSSTDLEKKEHGDIDDVYEGFTKRTEDLTSADNQRYEHEHELAEEPSLPDKTEPAETSDSEEGQQEEVDSEVDDEVDEESDQQLKDSEKEEIASRYEWLLKGSPSFSLGQAAKPRAERIEYNFRVPEHSTESVSYSNTQEVKETFFVQQVSESLEAERTEEKSYTSFTGVEPLMGNDTDERFDDESERTVVYNNSLEVKTLSHNLPCSNERTFLNESSEIVLSVAEEKHSTENLQRQESLNNDSALSEQAVTFVSSERRDFAPLTDSEQLRIEREIHSQELAHSWERLHSQELSLLVKRECSDEENVLQFMDSRDETRYEEHLSFRTELEEGVTDVEASAPATVLVRTTPSFADDKQESDEEEDLDRHITKGDFYLQNDEVPGRTYLCQIPDTIDNKEDACDSEMQEDRLSADLHTENMEKLMQEASIPQMLDDRPEWAVSRKTDSMSLDSLGCVEGEDKHTEGDVDDLSIDDIQYEDREEDTGDGIVDDEDVHLAGGGPAEDEMDDLTDDQQDDEDECSVASRAVESESAITFYPWSQELTMVQKTSSESASVSLAAELLSASSQSPLCFSAEADNESRTRISGQDKLELRESGLETEHSTLSNLQKTQDFRDSSSRVSMASSSVNNAAWSSELRENVLSFSSDSVLPSHEMTFLETRLGDDVCEENYTQLREEFVLKDYHQSTEKQSICEEEIVPVRATKREMSRTVEDQSLSPEEGWESEVSYKPNRSPSCLSQSSSFSQDSSEESEIHYRNKSSSNKTYQQERKKSVDEEEIISVKHPSRETNHAAGDSEPVSRTKRIECESKVSEDVNGSPVSLPVSVAFQVSSSSLKSPDITESFSGESPSNQPSLFRQEADVRQATSKSSEAFQRLSSSSLDESLTLSVSRMSAQLQDHGDLSPSQTVALPLVDAGASSESVVRFAAADQTVFFRPSAAAGSAQGTIWATTCSHASPALRQDRRLSDDGSSWEKFDQDHKPLIGGEAVNEDPALLDQENLDPNSMPFELFKKKNKTKRAKEAEVAENEVTDIIAEPVAAAESQETSVLVEENIVNQTSSSDDVGLTEVGEMTMKVVKSEQLYNETFELTEPKLETENLIQETSLEDSPAVLPTDDITDPVTPMDEGPQLSGEDAINAQPNKLEDVGVDGKGRERESLLRDHNPEGLVCCTIL